jgi:hypothetical protein
MQSLILVLGITVVVCSQQRHNVDMISTRIRHVHMMV